MPTYIKTITDKLGNLILPRTRSTAVTMSDGTSTLDDKLNAIDESIATHEADNTAGAHKAKNILVEDVDANFTSNPKNVENILKEVFLSGVSTKGDVVSILTSKGITGLTTESTWEEIETALQNMSLGKKWATGTATATGTPGGVGSLITGLNFYPTIIIIINEDSYYTRECHAVQLRTPTAPYTVQATGSYSTDRRFQIQDATGNNFYIKFLSTSSQTITGRWIVIE
jgi:hypothetical protein